MGYTLCNVRGRTGEANRQGSGCGLLEGRPPCRQFLRKNTNRQTSETPKIFRQFPTKRTDQQKPFDSKSFYALCCCPSHCGRHFVPTAQQNTFWRFSITASSKRRAPLTPQTGRHIPADLNPHVHRCDLIQLYAVRILAVPIKAIRVFPLLSVQLPVQQLEGHCRCTSLSVCLSFYFALYYNFLISKYSTQRNNVVKYPTQHQKKCRDSIFKSMDAGSRVDEGNRGGHGPK